MRDERNGDGRRDRRVERLRTLRVVGVVRSDHHVARLDRRERNAGERLADRVAQAEIRVWAQRADDKAVAWRREGEHRPVCARQLRRLLDDEVHEVVERALARSGETDLIQGLELHRATALGLAEAPVRVQRQTGTKGEDDHRRGDRRVDEQLDARVAQVRDDDQPGGECRGHRGKRQPRKLDHVA